MPRSHLLILLFFFIVVCALGALTFWYLSIPKDAKNSDASLALTTAEVGTFTDLEGNTVLLDNYTGTVRVVTTWASWNPFSVTDLQVQNSVAESYKDKKVAFLAINRKESKEQAERFLNSLPELQHLQFIIDVHDTFYAVTKGYAMPETIFYDTKGNVTFHKRGALTEIELREHIEAAALLSTHQLTTMTH